MSTADETPDPEPERYTAHERNDGAVRIVDSQNDDAWIESDMALSIGRRP